MLLCSNIKSKCLKCGGSIELGQWKSTVKSGFDRRAIEDYHPLCSPIKEDRIADQDLPKMQSAFHDSIAAATLASKPTTQSTMPSSFRSTIRRIFPREIKYISNPRLIHLLGNEHTQLRARIFVAATLINSHLLLLRDFPAFHIDTPWSFLAHVAGYFFFYIALMGLAGSFMLITFSKLGYVAASLFIEILKSSSPTDPIALWESRNQDALKEWSTDITAIAGEALIIVTILTSSGKAIPLF